MKLIIHVENAETAKPDSEMPVLVHEGTNAAEALAFINGLEWGSCTRTTIDFTGSVDGEGRSLRRSAKGDMCVRDLADAATWLMEMVPALRPEEEKEVVSITSQDVKEINAQDLLGGV